MKLKYIGAKPTKTDNIAQTGVVWNGHGDVQEVSDLVAGQLLKHTGVWVQDTGTKSENKPESNTGTSKSSEANGSTLDGLDKKALHELTKTHNLGIKWTVSADTMRGALIEAGVK